MLTLDGSAAYSEYLTSDTFKSLQATSGGRRSFNVVRLSFGNKLRVGGHQAWSASSGKWSMSMPKHPIAIMFTACREGTLGFFYFMRICPCALGGGWEGVQTDAGQKESAWILSWSPLHVYSCPFVRVKLSILRVLETGMVLWMESCSIRSVIGEIFWHNRLRS